MPFETIAPVRKAGLEAYLPTMPKPLIVAILDGGDEREGRTTAIVVHAFRYTHPPSGAQIDVPEGYITDFASIPAVVRGMFPPFGRHSKAAVLHDWLYLIGECGKRAFADRIFLDAMDELGVGRARRQIMYRAVRLGGGGGYAKGPSNWKDAFGDWVSGGPKPHGQPIEAYHQVNWPVKPRPDFHP